MHRLDSGSLRCECHLHSHQLAPRLPCKAAICRDALRQRHQLEQPASHLSPFRYCLNFTTHRDAAATAGFQLEKVRDQVVHPKILVIREQFRCMHCFQPRLESREAQVRSWRCQFANPQLCLNPGLLFRCLNRRQDPSLDSLLTKLRHLSLLPLKLCLQVHAHLRVLLQANAQLLEQPLR